MIVRFASDAKPNASAFKKVRALLSYLEEHPFYGMRDVVSAYHSVTVYYDPLRIRMNQRGRRTISEHVREQLTEILENIDEHRLPPPRRIDIPVCYGEPYGPDLTEVAEHSGLQPEEVIRIHSSVEYTVYMLGFAPGFPYLGGMDERIAMPRKATPRLRIPAGSVAIAGGQTGIYPLETPGGWNVIGRTPVRLFDWRKDSPTLLKAGDIVCFRPITQAEYLRMEEE